ncbi:MAG: branched-chain amino acid ABC transporter permease [Eubacterium sp.]|nr:branched-chain amino acid ABC transporter permease [Eubacterium sp.]
MYIGAQEVITAAAVLTAIVTIAGFFIHMHNWWLKQEKQDRDIEKMKDEQCLLTFGVLACLKGLKEQGCNGPVTEAINKIEKHLNQQAHE